MALLPIVKYPDPFLKQKAQPVTDFGGPLQELLDSMVETMFEEDGVGLAAPQIRVAQRILIACPRMEMGEEIILINPVISEHEGRVQGSEGCLSFPGISAEIPRAKKIRVTYQDRNGRPVDIIARDFFARIIQHEHDHLEGILLIDRVDFDRRAQLLALYRK